MNNIPFSEFDIFSKCQPLKNRENIKMNKQARNRTRTTEVEEPSDDALRQELSELERKFRIMQKEDHSYRTMTMRILGKQE